MKPSDDKQSVPFTTRQIASVPVCPEWLGDYGRQKWDEMLPLLVESHGDKFCRVDGDALASYCEAYESMREAMNRLEQHGSRDCSGPNGALYPHPAVGDKNKAIERMAKFRRELAIAFVARKAKKADQPAAKRKPA